MKTKRLLSTVLAVVMLLSVVSVACIAAVGPYTFAVTQGLDTTEYYDYERFDPSGIAVTVTDATGANVETVYYSSNPERFSFNVKPGAVLSVDVTAIEVTLDGQLAGTTPITVNHKYEENTSLGSQKHATRCAGCGDVIQDTVGEHVWKYTDDEAWEPNGDSTFTRDETESNFCTICNHEVKRDINSSAGYDIEFGEYQFLRDIMSYIEVLLDLIFGAIKR